MIPHGESFAKSLVWRITGIIWLAILTYLITKDTVATTGITIGHHTTCILTYFFHERVWAKIKWALGLKRRSILKSFTYEIITCHIMLGLIAWFFTQELKTMALIPVIYLNSRILMYYFYERIWGELFNHN